MIRVVLITVALALGARTATAQCAFSTTGTKDVAAAQLAYASAAAGAAPAAKTALAAALAEPFANTVTVGALTRVAIMVTNPTAERLRVSFDTAGGAHREVEWDPAVSSALSREVRLEAGAWTITAAAEPQTFNQAAGTVIIRSRFGALVAGAGATTIDGTYVAMAITSTPTDPTVITAWPRPRLTLVCDPPAVQAMVDLQFATSVTTSAADGSVRGLGVAPAIVTDTLALLAEIAIDRARAGALDVLRRRLIDPFCVEADTRASLRRLGLGTSGELALPRTCELLRSLRLDDVLASGRPLLIALRDDLRFAIAPAVAATLARGDVQLERALRGVVSIVNAAIERGGFDMLQGQLALELFAEVEHAGTALIPTVAAAISARVATELGTLASTDAAAVSAVAAVLGVPCTGAGCTAVERDAVATAVVARMGKGWRWADPITSDKLAAAVVASLDAAVGADALRDALGYGCQARLVVAIIKRCSGGGCTAGDLGAMLAQPSTYFAVERSLPGALCWPGGAYRAVPADLAAAQRMVVDGLALVAPVVDGQGRERARAAVRLIAQLVTRAATDRDATTIAAFADLAVAVIDEDYGTAFGRFLTLVESVTPTTPQHRVVRRFAQLIGAVASYAVVYRQTKDTDPAAARDARKRALSAIIDTFTDRTERGDEKIVSLGSNVGLSYSRRNIDQDATDGDRWQPAVRVPLGVRVEYLRKRDATGLAGVGVFGAVQLVDLGQFVRRDEGDELAEVQWADFLSLGAEAGISYAWFGRELNLAGHVSYGPSLRHTNDDIDNPHGTGVWTVGVALGYYVPFIDLN